MVYADDTTAYASDTSPLVLEYIINSNLRSVCKWFENNYLNINTTKTQAIGGSTKTWNPESGNGNGITETEYGIRERKFQAILFEKKMLAMTIK